MKNEKNKKKTQKTNNNKIVSRIHGKIQELKGH